jgi:AcrR family transcriptional regulator/DNA-binding MarR family transcriptional regulator
VVRAGLNGSPRTQVSEVQRARMLIGAVEVIGDLGYGGMSVARVCARAGVSRRTFYDLFEDREDCFLEVFEETVARACVVAQDAASGESTWRGRVRAGLSALLLFAGDEPVLGSLLVKDALGCGPIVLQARARRLETLHGIIDQGRDEAQAGGELPPLTAEGTVGAVLAVIYMRMLERDRRPLIELLNPLMSMIVLPFLGRGAAAKELTRPVATISDVRRKQPVGPPLDGLQMRVTYRTLRVLSAIAEDPGASNREVADAAGVQDQGQISKLLTRLENHGLVHNTGLGHTKGEPNVWSLTPKGREIEGWSGYGPRGRPPRSGLTV